MYHKHLCMKDKNERTYVVASWEYRLSFKPSEIKVKLVINYTALLCCLYLGMHRRITIVLVVQGILK